MKTFLIIILFTFIFTSMFAQTHKNTQQTKIIDTQLGKIYTYVQEVEGSIPIIFLHGVYFDHNLWNYQSSRITDRTVITVDMPFHGKSKGIKNENWTLGDCGDMLLEILDTLETEKVIAIGHSWGSMTVANAAQKEPQRFVSIGFCNMPFEASTFKTRLQFSIQHFLLRFRNFYAKQVAKAMYGKQTLKENSELLEHIELSMSKLSNSEIKHTDKSVIIQSKDNTENLKNLSAKALALKGKEDYVPTHSSINYTTVEGGHVSPLEVPQEVLEFVERVINLK